MKTFIRSLYQSFYSRELYQEAAYSWSGSGILLLGGLGLLGGIVGAIALFTLDSAGYSQFKQQLLEQFPQATIADGTLSIDRPSPYYMTFEDNKPFALIDTSDAATNRSLDDTLAMMRQDKIFAFAGKNTVIFCKDEKEECRIIGLKDFKEPVTFGSAEVAKGLWIGEICAVPLIILFAAGAIWLYKIVQMVLYSLTAIVLQKIMGTTLSYNALQRITALALFPATIFGFVLGLLGSDIPFLLSAACVMAFIAFGLDATKRVRYVG